MEGLQEARSGKGTAVRRPSHLLHFDFDLVRRHAVGPGGITDGVSRIVNIGTFGPGRRRAIRPAEGAAGLCRTYSDRKGEGCEKREQQGCSHAVSPWSLESIEGPTCADSG